MLPRISWPLVQSPISLSLERQVKEMELLETQSGM